jgi:hypothetical protein
MATTRIPELADRFVRNVEFPGIYKSDTKHEVTLVVPRKMLDQTIVALQSASTSDLKRMSILCYDSKKCDFIDFLERTKSSADLARVGSAITTADDGDSKMDVGAYGSCESNDNMLFAFEKILELKSRGNFCLIVSDNLYCEKERETVMQMLYDHLRKVKFYVIGVGASVSAQLTVSNMLLEFVTQLNRFDGVRFQYVNGTRGLRTALKSIIDVNSMLSKGNIVGNFSYSSDRGTVYVNQAVMLRQISHTDAKSAEPKTEFKLDLLVPIDSLVCLRYTCLEASVTVDTPSQQRMVFICDNKTISAILKERMKKAAEEAKKKAAEEAADIVTPPALAAAVDAIKPFVGHVGGTSLSILRQAMSFDPDNVVMREKILSIIDNCPERLSDEGIQFALSLRSLVSEKTSDAAKLLIAKSLRDGGFFGTLSPPKFTESSRSSESNVEAARCIVYYLDHRKVPVHGEMEETLAVAISTISAAGDDSKADESFGKSQIIRLCDTLFGTIQSTPGPLKIPVAVRKTREVGWSKTKKEFTTGLDMCNKSGKVTDDWMRDVADVLLLRLALLSQSDDHSASFDVGKGRKLVKSIEGMLSHLSENGWNKEAHVNHIDSTTLCLLKDLVAIGGIKV